MHALTSNLLLAPQRRNFVKSQRYGGGIYSLNSDVSIQDQVSIADNTGSAAGGGVFAYATQFSAIGAHISNNFGIMGGGMYLDTNTSARLIGTLLTSNEADVSGGAVYCAQCTALRFNNVNASLNVAQLKGGGLVSIYFCAYTHGL